MKSWVRNRWILLGLLGVVCLWGSQYVPIALKPNNDIKLWFEENDEQVEAYNEFQKEFGNDRIVIIAIKRDLGILTTENLSLLKQLDSALRTIEGIRDVVSILNAKDFRRVQKGGGRTIVFSPWFGSSLEPITPEKRDSIQSSSLLGGRLINQSGNVGLAIVHLEELEKIHREVHEIVGAIQGTSIAILGESNFHIVGSDVITFGINELSQKDLIKFIGISYLLMFVIMGILYQRVVFMLLSFLSSLSALWVTLSIYGFFGFGLNLFTVMTPPLIITMSIINVMHIINSYAHVRLQKNSLEKKDTVISSLSDVVKPCLYASLTTVIGFLSLVTSSTAILKEFGWLTALGCFLAFFFAFLWGAIFLFIAYPDFKHTSQFFIQRQVINLFGNIKRHPGRYTVLSIVISLAFISGLFFIKIDMFPLKYFPKNHFIVKDHVFMEENWGKYYPLDLVLELNEDVNLGDLSTIKAMLKFRELLSSYPIVGSSLSYVDVMDRFAQVTYRKKLQDVLADPFLMKSFSNSFSKFVDNSDNNLVSKDLRKARITVSGAMVSIREVEKNLIQLETQSREIFEGVGELKKVGYPSLFISLMNYAFASMKLSLFWAFAFVFATMLIILKSLKLAFIALVPNIFPILILLGSLGFLGINLDLATCTIAAIILGIAVDDTIHILYHFKEEKSLSEKSEQALLNTHRIIGTVVIMTSFILIIGFGVLLLASLKTVFYFGLLSILSILAALYGDLIILTLMLRKIK